MTGGLEQATMRDNELETFKAAGIRIQFSEPHNALLVPADQNAAKNVRQ
jgi:hypothetical protein